MKELIVGLSNRRNSIISTNRGGTIIAIIITLPLKKSGMLGKMKDSLEE